MALLYFAAVREAIGTSKERVRLPSEISTPRAVAEWLASRGGGYAEAFANPEKLRCAVDQTMTGLDATFIDAEEIAFFPPVTGG